MKTTRTILMPFAGLEGDRAEAEPQARAVVHLAEEEGDRSSRPVPITAHVYL